MPPQIPPCLPGMQQSLVVWSPRADNQTCPSPDRNLNMAFYYYEIVAQAG